MPEFIDLHLHLLPGVDDGPRTDQEAIELARELVSQGVARCAVTPHFNAWNPNGLTNRAEVEDAVARLTELLQSNDVTLEVLPGAEHFLTPELILEIERGDAPTLGGGPYILVELPFDNRPLYADDLLRQLTLRSLRPVLAHPARYRWVQSNPDALLPWIEDGILLQMTAGSIAGRYGPRVRQTAEYILGRGWYSLPGSDAHHPGQGRSLRAMFQSIWQLAGDTVAQILLLENPALALSGESLIPVPPFQVEERGQRRFRLFG